MIPNHSIAILTSERSTIADPRGRSPTASSRRSAEEIDEMKALIRDLERHR
jgi:hypothetical protein